MKIAAMCPQINRTPGGLHRGASDQYPAAAGGNACAHRAPSPCSASLRAAPRNFVKWQVRHARGASQHVARFPAGSVQTRCPELACWLHQPRGPEKEANWSSVTLPALTCSTSWSCMGPGEQTCAGVSSSTPKWKLACPLQLRSQLPASLLLCGRMSEQKPSSIKGVTQRADASMVTVLGRRAKHAGALGTADPWRPAASGPRGRPHGSMGAAAGPPRPPAPR